MTDEIDALERRGLEPTAEPACQPGGRKVASEPWQVEQVNAAMLRQRLEYRPPPAPRTGKAMHKDDRFALAGDPTLGRLPVDHELPNLHKDQFRSRWRGLGTASGIVDRAKARSVAAHLVGPRLFSGWGVWTPAVGEQRYNRIGDHVGTVRPFDNSFIAWGLRRYGFEEEAARIGAASHAADSSTGVCPKRSAAMTETSRSTRSSTRPRAARRLIVDPSLPTTIGHLELLDIPDRWGRTDAFGRAASGSRADDGEGAERAAGGDAPARIELAHAV
jgi:hypothetical protein